MAFAKLGSVNIQRIEIPVQGYHPCCDNQSILCNSSTTTNGMSERSSILSMVPISLTVEHIDPWKDQVKPTGVTRKSSTASSLEIIYQSSHSAQSTPKQNGERRIWLSRRLLANVESSNGLTRSRSHHSFRSIFAKHTSSTTTNVNDQSSPESTRLLQKNDSKSSISSNHLCLQSLLVQPLLNSDISSERKTSITPPPPPPSSATPSISSTYTKDEIESQKQRQSQIERIINKLIETMKRKHLENLQEVSKLWTGFKHLILDRIQQPNNFQYIFDYFYKMTQSNSALESLIKHNDEINAAFQVLTSTLIILKSNRTTINIDDLFNREEKQMLDQLNYQFDHLRSSYTDEHRFLTACIQSYQKRADDDDDYDFNTDRWMGILQNDYPRLIEKISTDYVAKIPSIEQILTKMLMNTKTEVIKLHLESS